MAFDSTNSTHLAALKNEVLTDPLGMGYDPTGATQQILKLLNDPAENLGGETDSRIFDSAAMLDALAPSDYDAQQTVSGAAEYVNSLLMYHRESGTIAAYKDKFKSLFAANSETVTALDAQNVVLSRGEVLFGQGTLITRNDWIAARES